MTQQTVEVMSEPTWEDVEHGTLKIMLDNDFSSAPEILLFDGVNRCAEEYIFPPPPGKSLCKRFSYLGQLLDNRREIIVYKCLPGQSRFGRTKH